MNTARSARGAAAGCAPRRCVVHPHRRAAPLVARAAAPDLNDPEVAKRMAAMQEAMQRPEVQAEVAQMQQAMASPVLQQRMAELRNVRTSGDSRAR